MKHLWLAIGFLTGCLVPSSYALADDTPEALLQDMRTASQSLNYEVSYINVSKQSIDAYRYRHLLSHNVPLAQLLSMDGPRREIVQRGKDISYFETGLQPFTMDGDHIVDALPSVVFGDFSSLAAYYDFISVGRARTLDRVSEVVRVVPRDGTRFSYVLWLDEKTRLPLRIDLLDRDGDTLEQFRAIALLTDEQVVDRMVDLQKAKLPPVIALPAADIPQFNWQPQWLPEGIKEVARTRRPLPNQSIEIDSRLYSDGLFSFSTNVSVSSSGTAEQLVRQGRRTLFTEVRDGNEITIVGELPPLTAKRIADSIVFSAQAQAQ
jgi:sigma-E factor negative regulatory protein RseB